MTEKCVPSTSPTRKLPICTKRSPAEDFRRLAPSEGRFFGLKVLKVERMSRRVVVEGLEENLGLAQSVPKPYLNPKIPYLFEALYKEIIIQSLKKQWLSRVHVDPANPEQALVLNLGALYWSLVQSSLLCYATAMQYFTVRYYTTFIPHDTAISLSILYHVALW